jgi:hypothetical protein
MTESNLPDDFSLSSYLKEEFDKKYHTVKKNGQVFPFSVEVLIKDLMEAGLSPFETFDVITTIKPHLQQGIDVKKILQLVYQVTQQKNIDPEILKVSFLQPILVEKEDSTTDVFSFKYIKDMFKSQLNNYNLSNKTFKFVVDELHRIVTSMRVSKIKEDTLIKLIPSAFRNVIGLNPFSTQYIHNTHEAITKMNNRLVVTWDILPIDEMMNTLITLFDSIYKVILLNFNYIPGYNEKSTIYQINQLISEISNNQDSVLSDKDIYLLGKSSREINSIINKSKNLKTIDKYEWKITIQSLKSLVDRLSEQGKINWIVVTDYAGNELYSKFNNKTSYRNHSLIGMALSGVDSLVNELTDRSIKQIDQEQGSSIIIERRTTFSILAHVSEGIPSIKSKIRKMADFIGRELKPILDSYKGNTSIISHELEQYVSYNFKNNFDISSES